MTSSTRPREARVTVTCERSGDEYALKVTDPAPASQRLYTSACSSASSGRTRRGQQVANNMLARPRPRLVRPEKRSNTRWCRAADAGPESVTFAHIHRRSLARNGDPASRGRVLDGIVQQIQNMRSSASSPRIGSSSERRQVSVFCLADASERPPRECSPPPIRQVEFLRDSGYCPASAASA